GTIFFVVADGSREASLRFWFPNLAFVLIVTAPIVTSRLVAEEWRSRHLDILLARPVAPAALVVGKWLAAVGYFVLFLAATLVYPVFLAQWGKPDWPPIIASYLGALLLVGVFTAVGTMTSAVTPTAVAAGLGAFAILVVGQLANNVPAFHGLSFQPHLESFARGAPGLEDAIYFASAMLAPLVVAAAWQTIRRRGASPLRGGRFRAAALPALVLAITLAVNLIPIPATARVDLTASHRYTLSKESKDVLRNVKQAVVTAFAPENSASARDAGVLLAQFRRANPAIHTRVLDFAKAQGEALRLGAQDDGEVVVEVGDRKEVVAPTIEQTISSALIRLARPTPQTLCGLEGNGERRLDDDEPQGLQLARLIAERNGIITIRGVDLTVADAIADDCTILVMAAPTATLLPKEIQVLNDWMANHGKLLILSEPGGANLDAITTRWGLRLLPGVVFDPPRANAGDPTALLVKDFPTESPVAKGVDSALLVTSGGITTAATEDAGLSVAKVLESSDQSWLELNPAATPPAYEPDKGDRGGPVVLAGAADRSEAKPSGEKRLPGDKASIARTRLLAFADADWASNAYAEQLSNAKLLANGLNWLAGEEDLVAIAGVDPDLRRLILTPSDRRLMGIGSIGAIPAAVMLIGAGVWLRRRRR
ncbi:MAG: Gldg family protein, partial [Actinobacteria bacterium]|nr:Gldg family protein [Actinomycetota bacterium]